MMLGLILIPFSQVILWKNEGRAVSFARLFNHARNACIKVDPTQPVNQEHEYQLVHMSGKVHNEVNLCDRDFGVVAQDSYRLKRKVEMFQWQETFHEAKKSGERAYYTYYKIWSDNPIDS